MIEKQEHRELLQHGIYICNRCVFKKTLNEKQRRKRKKIVGMPENKKIIGENRICNCHDFDMVFSCYDLTDFFKSANGKTSFLCCFLS